MNTLFMTRRVGLLVAAAVIVAGGLFVSIANATVSGVSITAPTSGVYWRAIQNVTWTASGTTTDVVYLAYSDDSFASSDQIAGPVAYDSGTASWDVSALADDVTYQVRVQNDVGTAYNTSAVFNIDNTAPESDISTDISPSITGWYNISTGVPTITLTCDDSTTGNSGCSETYYAWDAGTPIAYSGTGPFLAPEGEHTLSFYSEDNAVDKFGAHNQEVAQTLDFKVDTIAPSVSSYTIDGVAADGYFNPNVTTTVVETIASEDVTWVSLQFQKVSNNSDYKTYNVHPSYDGTDTASQAWNGDMSSGVLTDEAYEIEVHTKDVAGNETTEVLSPYTVTVDTVDPSIDSFVSPVADSVHKSTSPNGDTTASDALSFEVSDTNALTCSYAIDSGTPISFACNNGSSTDAVMSGLTDGRHEVEFIVEDAAGNSDSEGPISFVFDNNDTLTVGIGGGVVGAEDFDTIQEAVDKATAGDKIDISAGTYSEGVLIAKELSLVGPNQGIPANGARGTEANVADGYFKISTDNVTADGLAFTDGALVPAGEKSAVYIVGGHSGITVQNSVFTHPANAAPNKQDASRAVINEFGGTTGLSVSNNSFSGWHTGVYAQNAGASITDNSFVGNAVGISVDGADDITIEGNTFDANLFEAIGLGLDITLLDIHQNSFVNGGSADYISNYTSDSADATHNWFGTAVRDTILGYLNETPGDIIFEPYYVHSGMSILSDVPVSDVYVDDDYVDGSAGGHFFGYDAFDSVQDGVSATALSSGGTVHVALGTYTESGQILIDQDMTIDGEVGSKPVIYPSSDFTADNEAGAWWLVEAGVTLEINDLEVNGGANLVHQAIRSHGDTTIDNVDFRNIMGSVSGSPYRGIAISSYGGTVVGGAGSDSHGSGGSAAILKLTNSTFEDIGRIGVLIKGTDSTAQITDNTYTGKGAGDWLDYGFEVGAGGSATITGNTVSGNVGVASDGSTSAGMLVTTYYGAGSTADVNENEFTGNTAAISVGYDGSDTSSITARYNIFDGNDYGVETTAPTVDAEKNWWGDITGPVHSSNPVGIGDEVTDDVDFSPFCLTVPVGSFCDLGSIDPIASITLTPDPASQTVPFASEITIVAFDALGYTVVNDTSSQFSLSVDHSASLSDLFVTLTADGSTTFDVWNSITGIVNVGASLIGASPAITGATQVTFTPGDTTAPYVTSHSPVDSTTGVSITAPDLYVDFSEVLSATTTTSANIQLRKYSDDSVISATVALVEGGTRTTISPDTDLEYDTKYYFWVSGDVTDPSYNGVSPVLDDSTKVDHEFTTEEEPLDTTPPTITLLGVNPLYLTEGDFYSDPGATANDDEDGDISISIVVAGDTVDENTPGTYFVTYDVSDIAGNNATEEIRTVVVEAVDAPDTTPPTITLLGENPMTITVGDTFTDPGATANDNVDGDLTGDITFGGTIEDGDVTTTAGTYEVTYNVDDDEGNDAEEETRTVIVEEMFDDTASLAVTGIDSVKTYATDDDSYANGWSWVYHVTVPTDEDQFMMKFSDFFSGANTIVAADNIRFYSAQSSDSYDESTATYITAADMYEGPIDLDTDLHALTPGRQIEVTVEMKVPNGSAGGSYSGSYGIFSDTI